MEVSFDMNSDSTTSTIIAHRCICCMDSALAKSPAVLMPFVADRVFGHKPLEILPEWGFRDLRPGMAYTLCNSLQCQACGLLFLDYRFTDTQMDALYAGYRDERYNNERDYYEPGYADSSALCFRKRAGYIAEVERWLSPYLPVRPKILDWGGADGVNTPFLKTAELIHVHDISDMPLVNGVVRADPNQFGKLCYDLLVCSNVLEHVPFPYNFLSTVLPVLTENTLLYIEVPEESLIRDNPDNFDLAPLKHHWHEHINFFTKRSLDILLSRLGLQSIDDCVIPVELGERKGAARCILVRKTLASTL